MAGPFPRLYRRPAAGPRGYGRGTVLMVMGVDCWLSPDFMPFTSERQCDLTLPIGQHKSPGLGIQSVGQTTLGWLNRDQSGLRKLSPFLDTTRRTLIPYPHHGLPNSSVNAISPITSPIALLDFVVDESCSEL
jgi:hypothetical protein